MLLIMGGLLMGLARLCVGQDTSDDLAQAGLLRERIVQLYNAGRYDDAIPLAERQSVLFQRALALYKKHTGAEHALVASSLNILAELYKAKGDYAKAVQISMRSEQIFEDNINFEFSSGAEEWKQTYLDFLSGQTNSIVSLHVRSAPTNPLAAQLALTTILRRKGRALDAMVDQLTVLRRRAAPKDLKLLEGLAAARARLATLEALGTGPLTLKALQTSAGTDQIAIQAHRAEVARLTAAVKTLEADVSRSSSAEFRAQAQSITLAAVQQAIPANAALVEFFSYRPVNPSYRPFRPLNLQAESGSQRFGAAQYVAYILLHDTSVPQFIELGDAALIDAEVARLRAALKDPLRQDVKTLARTLDERVMLPVRKVLGPVRRLFISPDGALNLIPFAALVDEHGQYLIENYSLNYLTSGRDLLRLRVQSQTHTPVVVIANPSFDLAAASSRPIGQRTTAGAAGRRSGDFPQVHWEQLKGTAEEAEALKTILPSARFMTEGQATELALKHIVRPRILHLATHGFFLPDQLAEAMTETRGLELVGLGGESKEQESGHQENPLLRSGLILAGANNRWSGAGEDGILTALEVAGLNLWGTRLVVLSACETGLGDVKNGAGVYGLHRALVLAGSETQIMSLWQVSDAATRDLMVAYYKLLAAGASRTEALRQVQLRMLHETDLQDSGTQRDLKGSDVRTVKHRRSHPFYWAAFIASGAWTNMQDTEVAFRE
jgi:CHAT domain-containing protein